MNSCSKGLLAILYLACGMLFSCEANKETEESDLTLVRIHLNIKPEHTNNTRASTPITDPQVLDSLIQNFRILIMNNTGVCESYADFNPVRISQVDTFKIVSKIGMKNFIFLTNVASSTFMSNPVGKTADQILVTLQTEKMFGSYTQYTSAPQLFWSELNNILIQNNAMPIEVTVLQRIVSQLETSVYKQAYHTDTNGNKTTPFAAGYIQRLDSIYVYSISPDINMLKAINNRSGSIPKTDLTNSIIASSEWKTINPDKDRNVIISFPTEGQNIFPYLVFAAEVDQTNADFTPTAGDRTGPHGGVLRYWSFLLKQHQLTPNKRLIVDISALLGGGTPNPVPPPDSVMVEFNIQVKDWELIPDTITGGKDDFIP